MLTEKISRHLGVKYVYMPDREMFLCETGVPFTLAEYKKGIDLEKEYEKRQRSSFPLPSQSLNRWQTT